MWSRIILPALLVTACASMGGSVTSADTAEEAVPAAEGYSGYYSGLPLELTAPDMPSIPGNTVILSDFGGVADGVTLNTEAFRKAVSSLEKQGGGHLVVPAGVWLTGPIVLKDSIDLHLEKGAFLLASPDKTQFLRDDGKVTPFITASKRSDVSITGEGIIDGNGEWWRGVKRSKVSDVEWKDYQRMGGTVAENGTLWYPFSLNHLPDIAPTYKEQERMRTHLVRFTDCTRVLVSGVTLQNSPKFHLVPQRCKHVSIVGVTVRCPWNAQNGDGIDLMQSTDVLVADCTVDVGDDGICLKAGGGSAALKDGPTARVLICGNTVFHAHGGFVIGSEFSGGIEDVVVKDNTFSGTDTGLRFKSAPDRGGHTSRIRINNVYMSDIRDQAIVFETSYVNVPVGESGKKSDSCDIWMPDFRDIVIDGLVCRDARIGVSAQGEPATIHDISVKNSTIFYTETATSLSSPGLLDLEGLKLVSW